VVLGVAMDGPETVAQVGPWAQRYGLSFPVLLDEETRVVQQYNPKRAAPFNVMIGRDGAIAKTREGYSAGDEAELEADLKSLLAR
jgi:peroxiredoxin